MAPPKFPLKMQDGAQVRNMEELREHADLWTLEQSFQDGRLVRWLKVWYYAELAEAVQRLDGETSELHIQLCAVLGIPYLESMEAEYRATAAEAKLAVENTVEEVEESNSPESRAVAEPTPMSEEIADRIIDLIDYKGSASPRPTCYETKDYILCFSARPKPALLNASRAPKAAEYVSDSSFQPMKFVWDTFAGGVDLRISKRTGEAVDFSVAEDQKENLPMKNVMGFVLNLQYTVYENTIIYSTNGKLLQLELEQMEVTVLENNVEKGKFAPAASGNIIAFCDSNGLWLYNLKTKEKAAITAHGKKIIADGLSLTDDALYFTCRESNGNLDDGRNPGRCICMYDRASRKSRVLSQEQWSSNQNEYYSFGFDFANYSDAKLLFSYESTLSYSSTRYQYFDVNKAEVFPLLKESHEIKEVYPYHDGCLVFDTITGEGTTGYFVDFSAPNTPIKLADNFNWDRLSVFRIGNWFYYATGDINHRQRWKVSLDNPMQIIEFDCSD